MKNLCLLHWPLSIVWSSCLWEVVWRGVSIDRITITEAIQSYHSRAYRLYQKQEPIKETVRDPSGLEICHCLALLSIVDMVSWSVQRMEGYTGEEYDCVERWAPGEHGFEYVLLGPRSYICIASFHMTCPEISPAPGMRLVNRFNAYQRLDSESDFFDREPCVQNLYESLHPKGDLAYQIIRPSLDAANEVLDSELWEKYGHLSVEEGVWNEIEMM